MEFRLFISILIQYIKIIIVSKSNNSTNAITIGIKPFLILLHIGYIAGAIHNNVKVAYTSSTIITKPINYISTICFQFILFIFKFIINNIPKYITCH